MSFTENPPVGYQESVVTVSFSPFAPNTRMLCCVYGVLESEVPSNNSVMTHTEASPLLSVVCWPTEVNSAPPLSTRVVVTVWSGAERLFPPRM